MAFGRVRAENMLNAFPKSLDTLQDLAMCFLPLIEFFRWRC
jgi:hypothetical protein